MASPQSIVDKKATSDIQLDIDNATGVALVRLNRPAKRNALSQSMIDELSSVLAQLDSSTSVRAVVLTGSSSDGPFCGLHPTPHTLHHTTRYTKSNLAGVDISELSRISTAEAHSKRFLSDLTDSFARFSKPIIAAVVGFAVCYHLYPFLCMKGARLTIDKTQLGGGFEIALAVSDLLFAYLPVKAERYHNSNYGAV